jgi:glycerol-3-phosphate acyltransferase PlsY
LLLDALKGATAVLVVFAILSPNLFGASFATRLFGAGLHNPRNLAFVAALAAVTGHIFPVWLGFRGGKGVATGLGSCLLLTPKAILFGLAIFIVVLAAFRLVALASIAATASLPLLAWWMGEREKPVLLLGAASLLIIAKHHTNIARMLRGTEPRFVLRRRKKRITKVA